MAKFCVCIKADSGDHIAVGKLYEIVEERQKSVRVRTDKDSLFWYPKSYFRLTDYFPKKWFIKPSKLEEAREVAKWFDENFPDHSERKSCWYQNNALIIFERKYGYANHKVNEVICNPAPTDHITITFDQFKKYVMKEKEFTLPEKWCVRMSDPEVVSFFNEHGTMPPYAISKDLFGHYPHFMCADTCTTSHYIVIGYTEITIEQFKEHVLKQQQHMKRKIIGYLAPHDLFDGLIKKGDLVVLNPLGKKNKTYRAKNYNPNGYYVLPNEIVESWEPVYEQKKPKYKLGDYVTVIAPQSVIEGTWLKSTDRRTFMLQKEHEQYSGGIMWSTKKGGGNGLKEEWFRLATPEEIEYAREYKIVRGSNSTEIFIINGGIKVRSVVIDIDQLKEVVKAYDMISRTTVGGWNVTPVEEFRVGCETENNRFTIKDVKDIITAYEEHQNLFA